MMSMLNLFWIVPICVAIGYAIACMMWMASDKNTTTNVDLEDVIRAAKFASESTSEHCGGSGFDCGVCPVEDKCDKHKDASRYAKKWLIRHGIKIDKEKA